MKDKKKVIKSFILLISIFVFVLSVSYAFFAPFIGDGVFNNADVISGTTDDLYFTEGKELSITATQFNFGEAGENLSSETTVSANLRANSGDNYVSTTYQIYLNILENGYDYSTSEKTPEIILTITDPNGDEVTDLGLFDYISEGDVTGYDITDESGYILLFKDYEIESTSSDYYNVQNWTFKITYMNLDTDQEINEEKVFNAEIVLQKDLENLALFSLKRLNLESYLNTGTIDYNTVATSDEGIVSALDDLGTSYIFRGASQNNYVYFAGYYWRIIRINGDGSVRMIYDGTALYENGTVNSDRQLQAVVFASSRADNSYTGYMDGTVDGINFPSGGTVSTTFEESRGNLTDNKVKQFLEGTEATTGWYEENIYNKSYDRYIADAIYCNDRSLDGYPGYGQNTSFYTPYQRLMGSTISATLSCSSLEDRFSKYPKVSGVEGNNKLKYSIGLLTGDEAVYAGGTTSANKNYYLYTGDWYWTITPVGYANNGAGIAAIGENGQLNFKFSNVSYCGVKPVISLRNTAIIDGDGTREDPFVVK